MKFQFSEKTIQSIVTVVGVVLVFTYLGFARWSANRSAERYMPTVDGDCIERLNLATGGKVTMEELQQRCVR